MRAILHDVLDRVCACVLTSVLLWLDYRQVFDVRKLIGQLIICAPTILFLAHQITRQGFEAVTALNIDGRQLSSKDLCCVDFARVVSEWMPQVDQLQ